MIDFLALFLSFIFKWFTVGFVAAWGVLAAIILFVMIVETAEIIWKRVADWLD